MDSDVRLVPVRDLLRNLTDSMDEYDLLTPRGWLEMIREKSDDEQFWPLVASMLAHGQRDPICVTEWYDGYGEPRWEQGNGHHRLVAAILLGWDELLVDFSEEYSRRSDGSREIFIREWNEYLKAPA